MSKIIIAGCRDFADYDVIKKWADFYLQNLKDIEIVSGRCQIGVHTFTSKNGCEVFGVDGLGERYAQDKGYKVSLFPAEWARYGNSAGPIRNLEMVRYCHGSDNYLLAFWDLHSRGTRNIISLARQYYLGYKIITIS